MHMKQSGRRKTFKSGWNELWCFQEEPAWMQHSELLCWVGVQPANLTQGLSSDLGPAEKT